MIISIQRKYLSFSYRAFSALLAFTFILISMVPPQSVQAQGMPGTPTAGINLPIPGAMVTTSPTFVPPMLKGIIIHPEDPFEFDFVVDNGDSKLNEGKLKDESTRLIKYFLASLTLPESELWVNLSPYEKDRIIPDEFGTTEMGRDLLTQDYLLKQLTASLMYPEDELGQKFWDRVYEKIRERHNFNPDTPLLSGGRGPDADTSVGTSITREHRSRVLASVGVNTFNKVWIVPEEAHVYENVDRVFIIDSHLKVLLEEDYQLTQNSSYVGEGLKPSPTSPNSSIPVIEYSTKSPRNNSVGGSVMKQIIKEIIVPEIEHEINNGKNFAKLRQIYHSFILASWYKKNLKNSVLNKTYADQKKVLGLETNAKNTKEEIYNQYLKAFEKGVYDYIKEDYDESTQELVPRKYFSGGVGLVTPPIAAARAAMIELDSNDNVVKVRFRVPDGRQFSNSPIEGLGQSVQSSSPIASDSPKGEVIVGAEEVQAKIRMLLDGDGQIGQEPFAETFEVFDEGGSKLRYQFDVYGRMLEGEAEEWLGDLFKENPKKKVRADTTFPAVVGGSNVPFVIVRVKEILSGKPVGALVYHSVPGGVKVLRKFRGKSLRNEAPITERVNIVFESISKMLEEKLNISSGDELKKNEHLRKASFNKLMQHLGSYLFRRHYLWHGNVMGAFIAALGELKETGFANDINEGTLIVALREAGYKLPHLSTYYKLYAAALERGVDIRTRYEVLSAEKEDPKAAYVVLESEIRGLGLAGYKEKNLISFLWRSGLGTFWDFVRDRDVKAQSEELRISLANDFQLEEGRMDQDGAEDNAVAEIGSTQELMESLNQLMRLELAEGTRVHGAVMGEGHRIEIIGMHVPEHRFEERGNMPAWEVRKMNKFPLVTAEESKPFLMVRITGAADHNQGKGLGYLVVTPSVEGTRMIVSRSSIQSLDVSSFTAFQAWERWIRERVTMDSTAIVEKNIQQSSFPILVGWLGGYYYGRYYTTGESPRTAYERTIRTLRTLDSGYKGTMNFLHLANQLGMLSLKAPFRYLKYFPEYGEKGLDVPGRLKALEEDRNLFHGLRDLIEEVRQLDPEGESYKQAVQRVMGMYWLERGSFPLYFQYPLLLYFYFKDIGFEINAQEVQMFLAQSQEGDFGAFIHLYETLKMLNLYALAADEKRFNEVITEMGWSLEEQKAIRDVLRALEQQGMDWMRKGEPESLTDVLAQAGHGDNIEMVRDHLRQLKAVPSFVEFSPSILEAVLRELGFGFRFYQHAFYYKKYQAFRDEMDYDIKGKYMEYKAAENNELSAFIRVMEDLDQRGWKGNSYDILNILFLFGLISKYVGAQYKIYQHWKEGDVDLVVEHGRLIQEGVLDEDEQIDRIVELIKERGLNLPEGNWGRSLRSYIQYILISFRLRDGWDDREASVPASLFRESTQFSLDPEELLGELRIIQTDEIWALREFFSDLSGRGGVQARTLSLMRHLLMGKSVLDVAGEVGLSWEELEGELLTIVRLIDGEVDGDEDRVQSVVAELRKRSADEEAAKEEEAGSDEALEGKDTSIVNDVPEVGLDTIEYWQGIFKNRRNRGLLSPIEEQRLMDLIKFLMGKGGSRSIEIATDLILKFNVATSEWSEGTHSEGDLFPEASSPIDEIVVSSLPLDMQDPGGIDFNPDHLNIKTQGNRVNIPISEDQNFQNIKIDGLAPFVISITPVTAINIPFFLGLVEEETGAPTRKSSNYIPEQGPADHKQENYLKVSSLN